MTEFTVVLKAMPFVVTTLSCSKQVAAYRKSVLGLLEFVQTEIWE